MCNWRVTLLFLYIKTSIKRNWTCISNYNLLASPWTIQKKNLKKKKKKKLRRIINDPIFFMDGKLWRGFSLEQGWGGLWIGNPLCSPPHPTGPFIWFQMYWVMWAYHWEFNQNQFSIELVNGSPAMAQLITCLFWV